MDKIIQDMINDMLDCSESENATGFEQLYNSSREVQVAMPWLYYVACHGNLDLVKFLLANKHDVDERSDMSHRRRALSGECSKGHYDVAKELVNSGASLDTLNIDDCPLFSAISGRCFDCVKLLVEAGIEIHTIHNLGHRLKNSLDYADETGCTDISEYLRAHGAQLSPKQRG